MSVGLPGEPEERELVRINLRNRLIQLNTTAARVPGAVAFASKLRNQCDLLIANALTNGRNTEMVTNGELWLLNRLAPIASFVDIGANAGEWTAGALRGSPGARGLAFEPIAELAAGIDGAEVVCAAVGDDSSPPELEFFLHNVHTGSSFFGDWVGGSVADKRLVPVTTLDRELAEREISSVDIVKIDAEGYDLHVLRGAQAMLSRQAIDVVQFEYSHAWLYARSTLGEAINLLERHGYGVYLLGGDGPIEFNYQRHGEFFAYSNFVALSPAGWARLW
jgi:FkbM family methyltransferase